MDKLIIQGGVPLNGRIRVSGSKNAALPILMASILVDEPITFTNVPRLRDIFTTLKLLNILGCVSTFEDDCVRVESCDLKHEAPYELVKTMRASVLCLGPLLARLGRAKVSLPGGCAIGARPVDMHLTAFERMGATFDLDSGNIMGTCEHGLTGAHIQFPFPTVGGTENVLMGAALARGETILENAAREPEITDLANFLNACGARITGQGTSIIRVQGVDRLTGCAYRIMPDRIEAGTYLAAAAITDGELVLEDCPFHELDAVVTKMREMGVWINEREDGVVARRGTELVGVDVMTMPFPGFPTDMQAQIMALMTMARGSSVIEETIFENRFMHVQELVRLGAKIRLSGRTAMVRGVESLKGAPVMASDLRASASLVVAALAARGETEVLRIYHLDRGYEGIEKKLTNVGARIRRVPE
ncbi:MAG: UDP-N-acetylglucosamine 1-carboxyvinyltransferase [Desulfovibrionaceae bacterium]|jgi:UDP-N-acetylglucosamine 1-carboxyvinyltransferase|nr:UDP-N-acetylglucosamine 1-carboxyvinyltransferase [Desulfovibrionaceae bacterium]